ncbi:M24 family metallopeptidase [Subsaximicrobium wynnwilliamsii]|uniref:Xaa-Pro aminopeptidase n=1 Tax=Subsaximicrobium wynnwilliamsii TaxID=291179 RepID=A0A5C6ZKI9_9FLAO|nr:aminopeptidase P N-terminal domain-containing protein [Subsaximicrobium wynnwilliamsii]TXD84845.1 M24 family metallopeptidase [Subsaximicrobium wynnwilliamsii]TXD90516.1 M24 family metallopeptidase [Subsaximicrobium wynnwilliamsii]TXE04991.1 M24 family metallopeptidase [Subsaximicrobium wynnwilliamsii]
MKLFQTLILLISSCSIGFSQRGLPEDYLSAQFHKERRTELRNRMPANTVAVFFANAVRNRANDVDYVYHQDPNFYYLTGYKEPHAVLIVFSENQQDPDGTKYNEQLYVQERNARAEQWTGRRLGVEGAKAQLGFESAFNGSEFLNSKIDFSKYDKVMFTDFRDDYRDTRDKADLFDLVHSFKRQIQLIDDYKIENTTNDPEINDNANIKAEAVKTDTKSLSTLMAGLREIKTKAELVLLKKAVRISAMGQREIMKAMHPGMSETEIQGVHEYIYKKYGSEYEGYPSIVGAGNNGCVLHYIENSKTKVENDLVLMDLGAEYHGYTADVTRTIPANGTFNKEQKLIYDLVYEAQEAGIEACVVGASFQMPDAAARAIIYKGLVDLGIAKHESDARQYFPHGSSHHIGLDVHDPGLYRALEANMVITVEPGIYIPEGSDCDPKWYGIAVRIEDDILITAVGPENLSAEAPRSSSAIEKLMKEKSVLNALDLPNLD